MNYYNDFMKNIIDIYNIDECGLNAGAPANTLGMGNPMVPGDGEVCKLGTAGTEPLTGKCKKSKKKIYEEPKVKESILDDIDVQIQQGDKFAKLAPIVEWCFAPQDQAVLPLLFTLHNGRVHQPDKILFPDRLQLIIMRPNGVGLDGVLLRGR